MDSVGKSINQFNWNSTLEAIRGLKQSLSKRIRIRKKINLKQFT